MEFDEIVVKESPGLCRCCLSEGCYKDMGSEYTWMNENEVYADMLLECFDIGISQHNDGPNGPNRLICEVCITRLRDACNFKKQVVDSEKKFVDMIGRGEFRPKVLIYQSQMKAEVTEVEDNTEVEYLEEDLGDYGDDDEPLRSAAPVAGAGAGAGAAPGKRGRPRKALAAADKRRKADDRPKTSKGVVKGRDKRDTEARGKPSMTSRKRNELMKKNALIVLDYSTALPFKWQQPDFLCFFCHKTFKDTELLREHTKSYHDNSNVKVAVYYLSRDEKVKIDVSELFCKVCDEQQESLDELINHLKVEHELSFHEGCDYGLVPYRLLNEEWSCAVCQEEFQYFIKLNQHMNVHFGNYVCELCGKSFLSSHRLRCHSLRHGSKFRCNVCSETFESLIRRNAHEAKVHKKDKMLKCQYCPETFPSYVTRKVHHNTVHDVDMEVYTCPVCDKTFPIMSRLQTHFKAVHMKEKNFPCPTCGKKFFSRSALKRHATRHCFVRLDDVEDTREESDGSLEVESAVEVLE